MKFALLLPATMLLAAAPLTAGQGRVPVRKAQAVAPQPRPARVAPGVRWLAISDRPCDSTACRPIRFAWSPTAPGS